MMRFSPAAFALLTALCLSRVPLSAQVLKGQILGVITD